jgi:hypothetical protein
VSWSACTESEEEHVTGNIKTGIALALALAAAIQPAMALGQTESGTAAEGAVAGQTDGRTNTNGCLWFGAGCVFTYVGVGASYFITPDLPATRLLGKSFEYIAAYTDAYNSSARHVQTSNAWWGCILTNAVGWGAYIAIVLVMYAAAYQVQ